MKNLITFAFIAFITFAAAAQDSSDDKRKLPIINGSAKSLRSPEYPDELKKAGIGGQVRVLVTVDGKGDVVEAEITIADLEDDRYPKLTEMPHPKLQKTSLAAARKAKFSVTKATPPNGYRGIIIYNFVPPANNDSDEISDDNFMNILRPSEYSDPGNFSFIANENDGR